MLAITAAAILTAGEAPAPKLHLIENRTVKVILESSGWYLAYGKNSRDKDVIIAVRPNLNGSDGRRIIYARLDVLRKHQWTMRHIDGAQFDLSAWAGSAARRAKARLKRNILR
jgi:hypothetical protein